MRRIDILLIAAMTLLAPYAYADKNTANPSASDQPPQFVVPEHTQFSGRARLVQISAWLSKGILGESNEGLLVLRGKPQTGVEKAMKEENESREKNFKALSAKTATTVAAQRKLYAKKRRQESPAGTPLQNADGAWVIKT